MKKMKYVKGKQKWVHNLNSQFLKQWKTSMSYYTAVLVKNAVIVFFYELVPIRANIARVSAIAYLYLTNFFKKIALTALFDRMAV
jgi:hypothetical protein